MTRVLVECYGVELARPSYVYTSRDTSISGFDKDEGRWGVWSLRCHFCIVCNNVIDTLVNGVMRFGLLHKLGSDET